MTERLIGNQLAASRAQIRERLSRLGRLPRRGMFGIAEIAGLLVSAVMLLAVVFSYLYFLLPARSHLESLQLERSRLQTQLRVSREGIQQGVDTKATVQKITDSLSDFESNRLVQRSEGRMALYDELNDLIRKNGVRNTSGPSYTSLEPIGSKANQSAAATGKSAGAKWQSIYPGIAVSLTVEGQYQNLRRFVREIEANKQFLIVDDVELERGTESNAQLAADGGGAAAGGTVVSLRLDMATYFQRDKGDADSASSAPDHE